MTSDEFKNKVVDLMEELNKSNENKFNIFVHIRDTRDGDDFSFGYGCPACSAYDIGRLSDEGHFEHSARSKPNEIH